MVLYKHLLSPTSGLDSFLLPLPLPLPLPLSLSLGWLISISRFVLCAEYFIVEMVWVWVCVWERGVCWLNGEWHMVCVFVL